MIHSNDLLAYVIRPTLNELTAYSKYIKSEAAENLLLWTSLVESSVKGETYLQQINGPAISPWQIEPSTHDDIWNTFIIGRVSLSYLLRDIAGHRWSVHTSPSHIEMYSNLMYACAIARIKYWRVPKPLPDADDIEGMFQYWFKYYNANPEKEEAKRERFFSFAHKSLN